MARKIPVLGRVLSAPALYASVYGEIGSSLYYALGITAVYALQLTPVVFLIAGFLFAIAAAAYAEGGATINEPGGGAAFARRAFNDLVGFIAGWATILDYVIGIALAALFIPHYVAGAFGDPGDVSRLEATLLALGIVVAVTIARLVRRTDAYTVGVAVSLLDLVVQAGLAVLGLAILFDWSAITADIHFGVEPTWSAFAFSLPIAMIGFTGLEKVAGLAGEAKNPARDLPTSVRSSVVTVVLVYAAVATAATSAYPLHRDPAAPAGYSSELTTTWLDAPLLGLSHAIGTHLPDPLALLLRLTVASTATLILVLAITTSFSGCARLADAMGERSQLPSVLGRRGRRAVLPPWSMISVGGLASAFLIVGYLYGDKEEVLTLAALYSFGILIALMLANASIAWLRWTEPEMERPFTMRGNVPIAGRSIPVPAILGAAGAFAVWVVALGTHPGARVVGVGWMIAGLLMYTAVRVHARLPLMSKVEVAAAPIEDLVAAVHGTIVVPLEKYDALAEEVMATACRLATESEARVVGVSALVVPGARPAGHPAPGAGARHRAGAVDGRLPGRRLPRRVRRGRPPVARRRPDDRGRRHRAGRRPDRDRRGGQGAPGPQPRGRLLRRGRRLRAAPGSLQGADHALPRRTGRRGARCAGGPRLTPRPSGCRASRRSSAAWSRRAPPPARRSRAPRSPWPSPSTR